MLHRYVLFLVFLFVSSCGSSIENQESFVSEICGKGQVFSLHPTAKNLQVQVKDSTIWNMLVQQKEEKHRVVDFIRVMRALPEDEIFRQLHMKSWHLLSVSPSNLILSTGCPALYRTVEDASIRFKNGQNFGQEVEDLIRYNPDGILGLPAGIFALLINQPELAKAVSSGAHVRFVHLKALEDLASLNLLKGFGFNGSTLHFFSDTIVPAGLPVIQELDSFNGILNDSRQRNRYFVLNGGLKDVEAENYKDVLEEPSKKVRLYPFNEKTQQCHDMGPVRIQNRDVLNGLCVKGLFASAYVLDLVMGQDPRQNSMFQKTFEALYLASGNMD